MNSRWKSQWRSWPDPAAIDQAPDSEGRGNVTTARRAGPGLPPSAGEHRQFKTRDRVRDLAEVYTHDREVHAMLNLVPDMFPGSANPDNHDTTFFEPSCGSGNFLEEILRRKLLTVTASRYGRAEQYEHRILRCLASIYGLDIDGENVMESRGRLRAVINSHLGSDPGAQIRTEAFAAAVEVILETNIIQADTLAGATRTVLVRYCPAGDGMFIREWSFLEDPQGGSQLDLFGEIPETLRKDAEALHYSELRDRPAPTVSLS
jgi:hypothetical protein